MYREVLYSSSLIQCTLCAMLKEIEKLGRLQLSVPVYFETKPQLSFITDKFKVGAPQLAMDLICFLSFFIIKAHDFCAQMTEEESFKPVALNNIQTKQDGADSTPHILLNHVDHVGLWNWINTVYSYPDTDRHHVFNGSAAEQLDYLRLLLFNRQIRIVEHLFLNEYDEKKWKVVLDKTLIDLLYEHMAQETVDNILSHLESKHKFRYCSEEITKIIKKAKKRISESVEVPKKNLQLISDEVFNSLSEQEQQKYLKKKQLMEKNELESLNKKKQFEDQQRPLKISCTSDEELKSWDNFTTILKNIDTDWRRLCAEQLCFQPAKLKLMLDNNQFVPLQLLYLAFPVIMRYFDKNNVLYVVETEKLNFYATWWCQTRLINDDEQYIYKELLTPIKKLLHSE